MNALWQEQWRLIAARIDGLVAAMRIIPELGEQQHYGVSGYFCEQLNDIFDEMKRFFAVIDSSIPVAARARFDSFSVRHASVLNAGSVEHAASRLAYLIGLRAEMEWLLKDNDVRLQSIAERAFVHLQRLIVADAEIAKKWQTAFNDGETSCEKLGGTHLLHHGLWAFKADARGERTDLVLGNPIVIRA